MLAALDRLRLFLRPPGRGILTVSTGGGYAANVLKALYGSASASGVQSAWEETLQRIRRAEVAILGLPSDTGAGMMRGASFGPIGIREAYFAKYGTYPKGVLDLGDVVVVPHLLHDEMLSEDQKKHVRDALFPGRSEALPVSPLSIAEQALQAIHELNPGLKICLLGGDHSTSWPAMVDCHQRFGDRFAVLHFDAHTDLLERRFGVKYCFATWAYHAMKLMKPHHLIQVGIRTSGKPKEHWTTTYPVIQHWASDVASEQAITLDEIRAAFEKIAPVGIYVSNDIDGTDAAEAPSTGTPERDGLSSEFVLKVIETVGQVAPIIGSDITEVAPPLSGSREFGKEKTCLLAADYLKAQLTIMGARS